MSYLKDIEDIKKWGIEVEIRHNYLKIILIFEIIAQLLSNIIGHLLKKELAIKD
jgi:biotin operon repressor